MTMRRAGELGLIPYETESEEDFLERARISLGLVGPRPVTLADYRAYAEDYAGRGAVVTATEVPGRRIVFLAVHVPLYRRLIRWQKRRIKRRVQREMDLVRVVNVRICVRCD